MGKNINEENIDSYKYNPRHASEKDKNRSFNKKRLNDISKESNATNENNIIIETDTTKEQNNIKEINNIEDNNDKFFETKDIKIINKGNKEKKKRNPFLTFFIIIPLIIMGFSGYKIVIWYLDNKDTSDLMDRINEIVDVKEVNDSDNDNTIVSEGINENSPYWYYIKFPLIDVDITRLKQENSDIVGWINVNNTNINYPYVQTTNNEFYLDHSIDKSYNEAGWVFLDYRNNNNLNNKNNILYAHSRLDKTMFGSLSKVLKESWYNNKDNHIIRISTESENTLWQIFSVYKIKTESYYITTYFDNDDEYTTFLNTIKNRSLYDFSTSLNKEDKILTLSTCYSDTERTVVHAKLIKKSTK